MTDELSATCRAIYAETAELHREVGPLLGAADHGYRILYGPPQVGALVLFLGIQPGGSAADALEGEATGERESWPTQCEYAWQSYRLAQEVRSIWSTDFLESCVVLNVNFFRAPNVTAWHAVEPGLRRRIEQFCWPRAKRIVQLAAPKMVIVFGLGTFHRLRDVTSHASREPLIGATGRQLVRYGTVWGRPAVGVMHLTGSRISNADRALIAQHLRALPGVGEQ